jgi:anaerobic selenocysteine-containing dehydrogenase
MAVRTITCLPALTGDWRYVGGGAMLSTSKAYPLDDQALTRPDLIPPGTRTINMVQLAEALQGELPGPPVKALYVYNSNPAAVCPNQARVLDGLRREDLFTVVHDQFQTDTADYADIVLPATTQFEHFDIHNSYGHLHVQVNNPAIAPLGQAKPNTEVFRLLAAAMGFEPQYFSQTDEELAQLALGQDQERLAGITVDRLKREGSIRLNVPKNWAPFAQGGFPTSTGRCHLYSPSEYAAGRDPLPHYIPPHEDPQIRPDLAARYPLQLICPPSPSFLNSTFVNVEILRKAAGEPVVEMHRDDAEARGITTEQRVRVFNARGSFQARAVLADSVSPGVAVSYGIWWNKLTADGVNVNTTTSTAITDQGGGATFFDNLVEIELLP